MSALILLIIVVIVIAPAFSPEIERGLRHIFSSKCEHGIAWDSYCVPCQTWRDRR